MDMQKNIQEAKGALEQKPLYSATYERIFILNEIKSKYNHLKQPLRFAAVLGELLERVSLPLADYDLIAGRSLDRVLTDEEEALLREYVNSKDNPERETLLNSGHCTFSWESLVRLGLSGLLSRTEEKLAAEQDPTKRVFLEGMCGVYRALSRFALRYAKAAEEKGMTSLAQTLSAIAHRAPDSFREGLQLLWLVTFVDCSYISSNPTLTVGRLDVALYPLYQRDMERGTLTPLLAKAYITDYYCKHNLNMGRGEHQVGTAETTTSWERILNYDAPQYLLLGGTDEKGKSAVNDLTLLFAECICPAFKNPVVVVRYHKGMAKEHPLLWDVICQKGLASASMMIYNDDNVIEAFRKIGLPQDVCRQYSHFGCNWASAGERSSWMCSAPKSFLYCPDMDKEERVALNVPYMRTNAACSYPQDVVEIMEELCREEKECSIEDFYSRFLSRLDDFLDRKLAYLSHELSARQRAPSSLLSYADCFLDESFQNAACHSAGATYHFELQSFQMFGTVVDCFTVIDTLVFKDKKVTLKELLAATKANFVGYESTLALCRGVAKYGSDSPLSNYHTERLSNAFFDRVLEKNKPYLASQGLFLTPNMQSDMWHMRYGVLYGATPDGRRAYTPFSQNSRPSNGASTGGITAMLSSMLHLPAGKIVSGALNLDVSTAQFEGEEGKRLFSAMLASYFDRGGLHAQISRLDPALLEEAVKCPELHRDLRVRVTGYSGIFVDFTPDVQQDVIERMK